MKLNHVNLPVSDVAASTKFFEHYFDFKCIAVKGDNKMSILQGTDCFTLVLMADSFNRSGNTTYPDAFHIGFLLDTPGQVTEVYNRLIKGGITPGQAPGSLRGGFGFYFTAPGNILTEVTCNE